MVSNQFQRQTYTPVTTRRLLLTPFSPPGWRWCHRQGGLSLLLLERGMPGINVRRMKTQFDSCHGTTFILLEDVKVPKENIIGREGQGFGMLVRNFNHERWVIAAGAARQSRLCYEEAINESLSRQTFGKPLIQHQLIRYKLAEMARLLGPKIGNGNVFAIFKKHECD